MSNLEERLGRLEALHRAAVQLADPAHPLGAEARQLLLPSTGLSSAGVDYALRECLEHRTHRSVLSQLARRAPTASRVHVLLSANVFVAAFRAIAVALAQSPSVYVRPSRREPEMTRLLHRASGGAFELVDTLSPRPGEHLWAYGTDQTLARLKAELPGGVHLHAHGAGLGVAVIGRDTILRDVFVDEAADRLARDMVAFDQRGCLSPRLTLVEGDRRGAESFAGALARALARYEEAIPRGRLTQDEAADFIRYRDTMLYAADTLPAGKGLVVLDPVVDRLQVPPVGRVMHVTQVTSIESHFQTLAKRVTSVGISGHDRLEGILRATIGERRYVPLGQMQTPPLDGPSDLRVGWASEVL